jgi:hypothetical protein
VLKALPWFCPRKYEAEVVEKKLFCDCQYEALVVENAAPWFTVRMPPEF